MMAAQKQVLSTRAIEARVYHIRQNPRCRLYKYAPEAVQHITAGFWQARHSWSAITK